MGQGIIGDTFGTDLPQTEVSKEQLEAEQSAARFAKSTEYQQLKEHFENRISFYQTFLPGGEPVGTTKMTPEERSLQWQLANVIIGEFEQVLGIYELAKESVDGRKDS
jgi:DNA replication initiation complex subunit (GINS family)